MRRDQVQDVEERWKVTPTPPLLRPGVLVLSEVRSLGFCLPGHQGVALGKLEAGMFARRVSGLGTCFLPVCL